MGQLEHQRADRRCLDHLPACPRCGDLNQRGAENCATCGRQLLLQRMPAK